MITAITHNYASDQANFKNRTLFQGDNLDYLRLLNSESVDLIATDPPFNKGRDFHAKPTSVAKGARFHDRWSWEKDVHKDWLDEINDADKDTDLVNAIECVREAHSDAMGAYLCYMAVRLLSMRRILKHTGSIYLHCDPTASHYLKMIMDAIFGYKNFRNDIVWCYNVGGKGNKWWARKHDNLLFYTKTDKYHFDGKAVGIPRDTGSKSFGGKIGTDEDGRPYQDKIVKSTGKVYRYYLDEPKIPEDWWVGINSLQSGVAERVENNYPTQKPIALYVRIIKASSGKADIVLDPFCGCATTLVAAELNERQWIGIDLWEKTYHLVEQRLIRKGYLKGSGGLATVISGLEKGEITKITDLSQIEHYYAGEPAAPYQESIKRLHVAKEAWQKLSYRQMVAELGENEQKGEKPNESS